MLKLASGGLAASVVAAALAASVLPFAASGEEVNTRTRTVDLADLDLSDRDHADEAYERLAQAARATCRTNGDRTLIDHKVRRDCADAALADAVARLDAPRVTAIHRDRAPLAPADRIVTAADGSR